MGDRVIGHGGVDSDIGQLRAVEITFVVSEKVMLGERMIY